MRKHVLPLAVITATLVIWLIFYPKLGNQIPIHWNAAGQVDRYTSKFSGMVSLTVPMVLLYLLFVILPKVDPHRHNYKYFTRSYDWIQTSIMLFFAAINVMAVISGMGYDVSVSHLMQFLLGAVFIILGNFTQSVKPNFFLGIRTPWTLSNETVWKKTHRVGAKVMIIAGVLLIISGFLPDPWPIILTIALLIILAVLPLVYSYWIYRKLMKSAK
ncbi:SdpI family protein [Sporolactobacillus sp. Y61]|uniref:SdpI family protein n=1 Tax=Sporolactobacillus sp. Y61 TaxID=3160863 RepID=A0AAU8IHQ6_9BACL